MSPGDEFGNDQMGLVIDAAPVAMLVINQHGEITIANRHACATFGYPVEQMVGMNVDSLVPEGYRPTHHKYVESFFQAMVPRVMGVGREVFGIDVRGRQFPVEIGLSPMVSPAGQFVVAAIIDITERKRREKESTLARMVQESMLPKIPHELPGLELAAHSEPADATGGDFYDLIHFPDGRVGVIVGDASGHGFAAALVTATARSYLRALCRSESDLGLILTKTNLLLIDDVLESRFVTLLFAIFDVNAMTLSYSGAGHLGYLLNSAGELRGLLDTVGPPLGWFVDSEYPVTTVPLQHGDLCILLTDGIEEAMTPDGNQFGRSRVLDTLREVATQPAGQIVSALHATVHEFLGGDEPHDDATVIVGRVL